MEEAALPEVLHNEIYEVIKKQRNITVYGVTYYFMDVPELQAEH